MDKENPSTDELKVAEEVQAKILIDSRRLKCGPKPYYTITFTDGEQAEISEILVTDDNYKAHQMTVMALERIISHEQELRLKTQERLAAIELELKETKTKNDILYSFFESYMRWKPKRNRKK